MENLQTQPRVAIFPGSFDPFTVGHQSLVTRGLTFVDKLVIAIGINEQKRTCFTLEERIEAIRELYRDEPRVSVRAYRSLTVDFAREVGAQFILRGIRSVVDFEYEKNIADVNRRIAGIETLLLFAEPEYACISSSMVRELLHFGKDISPFLPRAGATPR